MKALPFPGAPNAPEAFITTVLLIDDDQDTREILSAMLVWRGYRVLTSDDGAEALGIARAEQPDVVVTEFLVPFDRGNCVLEELKRVPETAAISTIVLTTSDFPETRDRVARAGGIFAAKPTDPGAVVDLIEQLREPAAIHHVSCPPR